MYMKKMILSMILVAAMVVAVEASVQITGVSASASSEFLYQGNPFFTASHLVDGSGMIGDLHDTTAANMWLTEKPPAGPRFVYEHPAASNDYYFVEFDLGQVYQLGEMWVWNYAAINATGDYSARGLKDVYIKTSTDGVNWSLFAGPGYDNTHRLGKTNTTLGVPFAHNSEIDFGGMDARYVLVYSAPWVSGENGFIIEPEWGAYQGYWGLSEVRFHEVPEPTTLLILGLGGLMIRKK